MRVTRSVAAGTNRAPLWVCLGITVCYFCTNFVAASLFPGWGGDQLPAWCSCWYGLYNLSVRRVLRSALACSPYADAAYPPVAHPVLGTKAGTARYAEHIQQVPGVIL